MYQRYAGLIFDMDGTLFNSEPAHDRAWQLVLHKYSLRTDKQIMSSLNGSPTWCIAAEIIRLNGADLDPHRLAQEKNQLLATLSLGELQLLPAAEVVKNWYGRRPMAVGTGSDSKIAKALLEHAGLFNYFNCVVSADDVQQHKPAPDTFLRCAELIGVPAGQCVVFEDADFGVQAAQQAGMDVVDVRLL